MAWSNEGDRIYLLGTTRDEFAGSEWAHHVHGHLGGLPPKVDLAAEKALADVLIRGSQDGMIAAAHDVSDGGVAQALVEMSLKANMGADLSIPASLEPFVFLFSESTARAVVVVSADDEQRLLAECARVSVPVVAIGAVGDAGRVPAVRFDGLFEVSLEDLRAAHEATLPAALA